MTGISQTYLSLISQYGPAILRTQIYPGDYM